MSSGLLKRQSPSGDDQPRIKRQRTLSSSPSTVSQTSLDKSVRLQYESPIVTAHELARKGLRRGIALVLDRIGFGFANLDVMESFVALAETYLCSLAEDIRVYANTSRRIYPIPTDFENSLKRFNLSTSALKPHLRPPVPISKREPIWTSLDADESVVVDLPILGGELDGASDKSTKSFIPESFPSFPSTHTYKYTPENVELVTVSEDWGAFNPDVPSQTATGETVPSQSSEQQSKLKRPLAPHEIPRGDPKKIREAAVKEAKAGEEALRRLMRASKIAKQKEVWSTAQQEPARKERYGMWEEAMRELIEDHAKYEARRRRGRPTVTAFSATGQVMSSTWDKENEGRFEIADHSMIVNSENRYSRKEVPRSGARNAAGEGILGKG